MKFVVAVSAATVVGVTGAGHADDARPADGPLRAVLYEVGRDHTAQKGFVGSVVWHNDAIASSAESLRADIEIPDLEMRANLVVARNDDRSFQASHTIEIMVTLPPDFVHGRVINVPRIVMKEGETAPGIPLKSVAVKITPRLFQIGLSNIGTDRQRNIELIKELSWIDLPIVYSDGSLAILGIEKAPLGDRGLAVLESSPAVDPVTPVQSGETTASPPPKPATTIARAPTDHSLPGAVLKPSPIRPLIKSILLPHPVQPSGPLSPRTTVPSRPSWVWPPSELWSWAPGSPMVSWAFQEWPPALREMIRVASTIVLTSTQGVRLPSWVQDTSAAMTTELVPPWPRVRAPDFRIPMGRSRFADLEPPARFVRWSDRIEIVLPIDEVGRRCRASLGKSPRAGNVYRGCARGVAGRCFITRVDEPGVARHELAHCNGWKHPLP